MSDAARKRGARSSATARRRFSLVRLAARSGRPSVCAARRAASGSGAGRRENLSMPAGISGTTRKPAGTWAAACPWWRRSGRGDVRPDFTTSIVPPVNAVPAADGSVISVVVRLARPAIRIAATVVRSCDGTGLGGPDDAGSRLYRAASSGAAFRALYSALVGVQPTTVSGPRPSGPGKAAASSRFALPLRRDSVVTSATRTATRSERASDDAATGSRLAAEVVGTQRRTRVSGVVLAATWSGARWCPCSTVRFSSENPLRSDDRCRQAESRNGGLLLKLGGRCIPALS